MKTSVLFSLCMVISVISLNAQVTQINNNNSLEGPVPLAPGRTIVVSRIDSSIWVTDATAPGTVQISSIKHEGYMGVLAGKYIFRGSTPATGEEIYITDGTSGGTALVRDIVPGATGSLPGDQGSMLGGFIYFTAETPAEGRELWRTNGTLAGTTLVKDIVTGPAGSNVIYQYHLFSNGTYLLFAAETASAGVELWKSDGSNGGTVLLKEINTGNGGADSSNPSSFFKYNNMVLFIATDAANGEEIWKTDGTPGGTVLVKDINPGSASSTTDSIEIAPGFFFEYPVFLSFHLFNNRAYFIANDGINGGEIWSTDGNEANTSLLKNILPGNSTLTGRISLFNAINVGGKFIFPVSDTTRSELWESNGTTAGTQLLKAFTPNDSLRIPFIFLNYSFDFTTGALTNPLFQGNKFFFAAGTDDFGYELWISDGTVAGTTMVKDINPNIGSGISFTSGLSYLYTTTELFFAANNGTNGNELWRSDGTSGGTTIVQDINLGAGGSNPGFPALIFGKIIFSATEGNHTTFRDLFVIDGTFQALPVTLSNFTVKLKGKDALLQWSTLQEVNSKDFTIQRSFDGRKFEDIGVVRALGTSSSKHDYSYIDAGIANSGKTMVYYSLLSADKDGRSKNSNVISLKLKGNSEWNVRLLSNPVHNNINVMLSGITENVHLTITDLNGKTFYKNSLQNVNGLINVPADNLQSGIYILIAETKNERKIVRFVK